MKGPYILLSGMACNKKLWSSFLRYSTVSNRFKYVDLTQSLSLHNMFDCIDRAIDGRDEVGMLGFSMGGFIALEYLLSRQTKIGRLILVNCSAKGYTTAVTKMREEAVIKVQTGEVSWSSQDRLKQFLYRDHPLYLQNLDELTCMTKDVGKEAYIRQQVATIERPNREGKLSDINIPSWVIRAEHDSMISVRDADRLHRSLPQPIGSVVNISGSGHMLPIEQPESLARVVDACVSL